MKYIRTKDGKIYEKEYVDYDELLNTWHYHGCYIYDGEAITQADTIEELCDCFISARDEYHDLWDNFEEPKTLCSESKVYGAIWTDKGLIYVAKMNDKGDLELL